MATPEMTQPALEVCDLVASHGHDDVLSAIGFTLARGEWLAVMGPNGSGKSTLLDAVCGRLAPRSGSVWISGHDLGADPLAAKRALGYAIAAENLPPLLTGRQCISVHAAVRQVDDPDPALAALVEALGIGRWLDDPVAMMSYGTRQKFGVVLALVGAPPLVVLDESFNGLDPASSQVLKHHLRERTEAGSCAILLATHAIDLVERFADRALLLDGGRIAHAWSRDALRAARNAEGGLEAAMARVLMPA